LEATSPGQTITLRCEPEGANAVVFSVHNDGFIPRDVQLQIFHRAFSTKGTGRGLGTYSMKLLGERYLGGQIRFESSPESGTTFMARFPLIPAAQ
jgi:sensor histidine kinase regulating citrate/malate metabolism